MTEIAANGRPLVETVNLEEPIVRGEETIKNIDVRRPIAGELSGLSLRDIVDMESTSMLNLLPRITMPPLLPHELAMMGASDFVALSAEASGFFLPKAVRPVSQP